MYVHELNSLFLDNVFFYYTLIAEMSLKSLAPWIMLLIALWGIGRLFRPGQQEENPDTQDNQVWDESYEYEGGEFEDDYDGDEEEE